METKQEFGQISVTLVYSTYPREITEVDFRIQSGTSLSEFLRSDELNQHIQQLPTRFSEAGIWGRKVKPGEILREGDRVELYRPLKVDPKIARRERFQKQGARSAGLFSSRRKEAKPGY